MTRNIRVILPIFLLLIALSAVGNFYHGNHLGSASWITNADGDPVQYLMYAPYGENDSTCD